MRDNDLTWLQELLARLENKVDDLTTDTKVRLARIELDISYHIKRTDDLQDLYLQVRDGVAESVTKEEFKPVRQHVERIQSLKWLFGGLVALGGAYKIAQSIGMVP